MNIEHIKEQLRSKKCREIIGGLGIAVIALMLFWAGMEVGYTKAAFSYRFGDDYYRSFGPNSAVRGSGFIPNDVSESHGTAGNIVSIDLPTMIVADRDNTEKVIRISNDTVVRRLRDTIMPSDLEVGDFVVVIGAPESTNEVGAKLIRVMSSPPAAVPGPQPGTAPQ